MQKDAPQILLRHKKKCCANEDYCAIKDCGATKKKTAAPSKTINMYVYYIYIPASSDSGMVKDSNSKAKKRGSNFGVSFKVISTCEYIEKHMMVFIAHYLGARKFFSKF